MRSVVALRDQRVGLGFFFLLALDEVDDIGMVDVEDDHLGGAARLASGLDDAGEGVETFHEAERAAGGASAGEASVEERSGERLVPVPLPHLKSMPSVLARVRIESSESFTELMKQAEHCGRVYPVTPNSTCWVAAFQCQLVASELGSMRSHPTLNQTGELKAAYWRMSEMDEFVVEGGGVFAGAEVAVFHAPVADGLGDAGDELADSGLALVGADLPVEIFGGDDVGRGHRPVFGDLDVLLLEDDAALGVGDRGGAELPFDVVVGRHAGLGEEAAEGEAGSLLLIGGGGGIDLVF